MKSLLIGCGNDRTKKVYRQGCEEWAGTLVTIDMNPNCGADHVLDMSVSCRFMPFADETFDEIGAYDCLEHWGDQGNWRWWFEEMSEYHRILKPGGTMGILVPIGGDALADPGHTRMFHPNHFGFLSQDFYKKQEVAKAPFTDYRWFWKKDFAIEHLANEGGHHLSVLLRKVS